MNANDPKVIIEKYFRDRFEFRFEIDVIRILMARVFNLIQKHISQNVFPLYFGNNLLRIE